MHVDASGNAVAELALHEMRNADRKLHDLEPALDSAGPGVAVANLGSAIDAGLIYEVAKNVPVSVAVQNVGIATKFIDKEKKLINRFRAGSRA